MHLNIGRLSFYRETKAFAKSVWVCVDANGFLYIEDSIFKLIKTLIFEWRNDRHLVGY